MEKLNMILNGKYGYTENDGTKLALTEEAYLENVPYAGEIKTAYVAHAINADDKNDKTVYLCIWPDEPEDGDAEDYNEPSDYIDWSVCERVTETSDDYDEMLEAFGRDNNSLGASVSDEGDGKKFVEACQRICQQEVNAFRAAYPDHARPSMNFAYGQCFSNLDGARDDVEHYVTEKLIPSGSGFNFDWDIDFVKEDDGRGTIRASSFYEGMNEGGSYLEPVAIRVDIPMDDIDAFEITIDPAHDWKESDFEREYEDVFSGFADMENYIGEVVANTMSCDNLMQDNREEYAAYLAKQAKFLGYETPVYDERQDLLKNFQEAQQAVAEQAKSYDDTIQVDFAKAYVKGMEEDVKEPDANPYINPLTRAVAHMLRDRKYLPEQIDLIASRMAPEKDFPDWRGQNNGYELIHQNHLSDTVKAAIKKNYQI